MISLENLPMKGVYSLVIWLNSETSLQIRKLGCFKLQGGYYAYTGSALGNGATSLRRRVARHLRKTKTKHWHIDFFLADKNAKAAAVVAAESSTRKECEINDFIKKIEGTIIPIKGFGSSDCGNKCGSHLVYFGEENVKEKIADAYRHLFGYCNVLDLFQIKCGSERVENNLKATVESADLTDIEELLRIERECFTGEAFTKEEIFLLLTNPNAVSLVAKVNGEVAGFIIGVVENQGAVKAGHVFTIDIALKHRRKGLGMKLLEEIEKTFINRGSETSYLEVRVDNKAARRLYEKQGYRETKSLDHYYSTGIHGFRLIKRLTT